jgi:hypothetical protein
MISQAIQVQFADPAVMAAYLVLRAAETERDAEDSISQSYEQIQYKEEGDQIEAMRQEASHVLAEGIASGVGQIAEGGLHIAAACAVRTEPTKEQTSPTKDQASADTREMTAPTHAPTTTWIVLKASAVGAGGAQTAATHYFQAAEKQDQVMQKQAERSAQLAQQQAQDAHRAANDADDSAKHALEAMKAFLDLQNQTRLAQLRG